MIGKRLSPILTEIADAIWEFEANSNMKPEFTDEGFRSALKIFMCILMDKIWELQADEEMSMDDRLKIVFKAGTDLRDLVKTYTGIDTHNLYPNSIKTESKIK